MPAPVPDPLSRTGHRGRSAAAAALGVGLLFSACASPGPVPPVILPPVEFLGVSQAVEFRDREGPVDETEDLPSTLTLPEVLRRSLLSSPELQAALARARIAEADARQERLLPNPILSVALRTVEGAGTPSLDLGISEDILALMTRAPRADGADARLRAAVAEAGTVALDVAAEAASLALEVRSLEGRLPLLEGKVDVLRLLLEATEARHRSGEGSSLEVTVVEEEMAAADLDVLEARAEARLARLSLARRMGRPGDAADWTIEPPAFGGAVPAEAAWIAAAAEGRPELRVLDWEMQALEAEARMVGLSPREGMEGGIEIEGMDDWEAGPAIAIPLPFFDDGSERGAAVLARMAEVRHRRTAAARLVVEEVRRALASLESAVAVRGLAAGRLLPLSDKRRTEAAAIHRSGESDLVDMLLAENALHEARLRVLDAESRSASARVRLLRAAGGVPPGAAPSSNPPGPVAPPGETTHDER